MPLRILLLAGAACLWPTLPAAAQNAPGPRPPIDPPPGPQLPQFPPVRIGCGLPEANTVVCRGAIPGGVNYQEIIDLDVTLDPSAQVSGGVRVGGTRIVPRPGGSRFEWAATGTVRVGMEAGSSVLNAAGTGIFVAAQQGIDIVAEDITANGEWGIRAFSWDAINVQAKGDITLTTNAEGYSGISAHSAFDDVRVNNDGTVAVTASQAAGILATAATGAENATGSVIVINNGTIRMVGTGNTGIVGIGGVAGSVTLINNGTIETDIYGMIASVSREAGALRNAGSITTTGTLGHGMWVRSITADATALNDGSGRISTSGDDAVGILLAHQVDYRGDAPLLLHAANFGSITTEGRRADGVVAASLIGAVAIENHGSIATAGSEANGISVYSAETGAGIDIVNHGIVETSGDAAAGILVLGNDNRTRLDARGTIWTSGANSHGIAVDELGGGLIEVTAGQIAVSGEDADAIRLSSATGDMHIGVSGSVSARSGYGIAADASDGATSLSIGAGGHVSGGEGALRILAASGAAITVEAGGEIAGSIETGAGADIIRNAGTLSLSGVSQLGGGEDGIENSGTLRATLGTARVDGLERLMNGGLVSLVDADANDVLDLGGAEWIGASGSTIAFNLSRTPQGIAADRLRMGGASGVTTISLIPEAGPVPIGLSARLIEASSPIPPGAFVLDPTASDVGFTAFALTTDSSGILLSTEPGAAVYHAAYAGSSIGQSWREGAEAFSAHRQAARLRGPETAGGGFWLQAIGGETRSSARTRHATGTDGSYSASFATRDRYQGVQGGAERQIGALALGLTGGYLAGTARFRGTADRLESEVLNAGAYVAWTGSGGLFANLVAKVDKFDLQVDLPGADFKARTTGWTYGALLEGGARAPIGGLVLEPQVRFSWSSASINAIEKDGVRLDFGDAGSALVEAGARLVSPSATIGGVAVTTALGLFAERQLAEAPLLGFTAAQTGVVVEDRLDRTRARGELAAAFAIGPGLGAYVQSELQFGLTRGNAVTAGLHFEW